MTLKELSDDTDPKSPRRKTAVWYEKQKESGPAICNQTSLSCGHTWSNYSKNPQMEIEYHPFADMMQEGDADRVILDYIVLSGKMT